MDQPAVPHEDDPAGEGNESRPLLDLLRIVGRPCAACGGICSAGEMVWSIVLGFKDAPRCLPCLARGLGREEGDLRDRLSDYVHRRECYRAAWAEAERLDGRPAVSPAARGAAPHDDTPVTADADTEVGWDAGPMACGELTLGLRAKLASLPAGAVIRIRATDEAAPEDIPAWCRLTGHKLVSASPPEYRIRRKGA